MTKKMTSVLGAVAFAAASATLAAQVPSPSPGPTPQPGRASSVGAPITVNGCVERSGSGAGATFKLTKVERGAVSTAAPTATRPGEVTPAPSAPQAPTTPSQPGAQPSARGSALDIPKELVIKSTPTVDLNQHASHKVELTGTLDDDYATTSRVTPTTPGAPSAAPGRDADSPEFSITSLKMVAASCN